MAPKQILHSVGEIDSLDGLYIHIPSTPGITYGQVACSDVILYTIQCYMHMIKV